MRGKFCFAVFGIKRNDEIIEHQKQKEKEMKKKNLRVEMAAATEEMRKLVK